jgi:phage gpG-like protein
VTVEVRGADTLARTLRTAAQEISHLDAAHQAAGAAVAAKARPRTRRKTGRLAASWTVRVTADGAEVGSPVNYAGVQEYGWAAHNISPSRALTGGLADATDPVARIYFDAVDGAIGKVRGI